MNKKMKEAIDRVFETNNRADYWIESIRGEVKPISSNHRGNVKQVCRSLIHFIDLVRSNESDFPDAFQNDLIDAIEVIFERINKQ